MFKNPYKGKFIVFEGLDGSGSTTQAAKLAKFLKDNKIRVHQTKEPTSYLIGGLIRSWLASDWSSSPICLQLLFTADRAHHLEKEVIPLLKRGVYVVSDRYFLSTLAFGANEIPDRQWLKDINKIFLLPDLTFYSKVRPRVCLERISESRHHFELFEKENSLKQVEKNYEEFIREYPRIITLDGEKPEEEVFFEIEKVVKRMLL